LEERRHALAVVLRLTTAEMRDRLTIEERAEVARRCEVHVLLHVTVADEGPMRDPARDLAHLRRENVLREHPVHEPEAQRLFGADQLREEEELLRLRGTDPARQLPRRPEVAAEADLRERRPEA